MVQYVMTVCFVFVCDSAPVGSALSTYFGHRPVVVVGGLLSSIGMVAGSYAQDLLQLYITVGFLTGKSAASSGAYGCTHTHSCFQCFSEDSQLEKPFIVAVWDLIHEPLRFKNTGEHMMK